MVYHSKSWIFAAKPGWTGHLIVDSPLALLVTRFAGVVCGFSGGGGRGSCSRGSTSRGRGDGLVSGESVFGMVQNDSVNG